jgi:hypothetical protein
VKRFLAGVLVGAVLWYVLVEYDAYLVSEFIKREQMTVRPRPKYRPDYE